MRYCKTTNLLTAEIQVFSYRTARHAFSAYSSIPSLLFDYGNNVSIVCYFLSQNCWGVKYRIYSLWYLIQVFQFVRLILERNGIFVHKLAWDCIWISIEFLRSLQPLYTHETWQTWKLMEMYLLYYAHTFQYLISFLFEYFHCENESCDDTREFSSNATNVLRFKSLLVAKENERE